MKILVTGGAGYIGTFLVEFLLRKGYTVLCLDKLLYGDKFIKDFLRDPNFRIIRDDTRTFDPSVLNGIDAVVDLAAIAQPDPTGKVPEEKYININYKGSVRVASLSKKHGVTKYVFASTCSVYGARQVPVDETCKPQPIEAYAKSKAMAEQEILGLSDKKFCATILRFATCYGLSRKMRFDLVVNAMTLNLFRTGKIRVGRPGTQVRPLVHVKDVARAIIHVLESEEDKVCNEIFNVGSNDQNYQIKQLADEIGKAIGRPYEIEYYGEPDMRSYIVKFDKIEKTLGFKVKHTVADGAREIYQALEKGLVKPSPETYIVDWIAKLAREGKI